jgi:putative N6-adenine-specific DNA methylase
VHGFLEASKGALYLDTSGEPLFKRGWRAGAADAPLRENLAAGILMLTGWKPEEVLLDPMCGGGTFLVEAGAMARGRAPGGKRAFGFEKLAAFEPGTWEKVKREPKGGQKAGEEKAPQLYGSDRDPKALNATRRNLAEAGVERWTRIERIDVLERTAPAPAGVMVMNPPYGERMGSADELARFYPRLGDHLKKSFAGWRCYVFTADLRAAKLIGLSPSKRIPLWNGALECRLYEFEIVSGSHRRPK